MGGQKGRRVAGAIVALSLGEVLGLLEARPAEFRIYEDGAFEVRIVKDRALQIGSLEVGSVQAGVRKVRHLGACCCSEAATMEAVATVVMAAEAATMDAVATVVAAATVAEAVAGGAAGGAAAVAEAAV
jgi:hypothetical protein